MKYHPISYLMILALFIISSGCNRLFERLPYGSKLADDVALGEFKKYNEIKQIEIYFYSQRSEIRSFNELKNKKRIVVSRQEDINKFMEKLGDHAGIMEVRGDRKLLTRGICFIRFENEYVHFYFYLYEKSVYIQPPSFKNEFGAHGLPNAKIFPIFYQLYKEGKEGVTY